MQNQSQKQGESCNTRYCLMDQIYHLQDRDVRIPAIEAHILIDSGKVIISAEEEQRIAGVLAKAVQDHKSAD